MTLGYQLFHRFEHYKEAQDNLLISKIADAIVLLK
jgi:hypothetical protein